MWLFWSVCLPMRLLFAGTLVQYTFVTDVRTLMYVGVASGVIVMGFVGSGIAHYGGLKKRGFLGGEIWWNRARLVHIGLWSACSLFSFASWPGGGLFVLVDVVLGAVFGVMRHMHGETL